MGLSMLKLDAIFGTMHKQVNAMNKQLWLSKRSMGCSSRCTSRLVVVWGARSWKVMNRSQKWKIMKGIYTRLMLMKETSGPHSRGCRLLSQVKHGISLVRNHPWEVVLWETKSLGGELSLYGTMAGHNCPGVVSPLLFSRGDNLIGFI